MTAVGPNRAPQPGEAAHLREHLAADRAEHEVLLSRLERARRCDVEAQQQLLAAQQKADSTSRSVQRLESKLSANIEGMGAARALLHPVRRMPYDLLREVYLWWLHSDFYDDNNLDDISDLVPFRAAAVCKSWRSAALSTPVLWSLITIQLDRLSRRAPTGSACDAWQARITAHTNRMIPRLVILRVVGNTTEMPVWITMSLGSLASVARSVRIIDPAHQLGDIIHHFVRPAWAIEELTFISHSYPRVPTAGLSTHAIAESLRSLTVFGYSIDWAERKFLHLVKLSVGDYEEEMSRTEMRNIACSVPSLQELELHVRRIHTVNGESLGLPNVTFHNVRKLDICSYHVENDVNEWLCWPAVTSAVVRSWGRESNDNDDQQCDLSHFIETLCDSSSNYNRMCSLTSLHLQGIYLDHRTAIALTSTPLLHSLKLEECFVTPRRNDNEFFAALGTPGSQGWIVPLLRELVLVSMCSERPLRPDQIDLDKHLARDTFAGSVLDMLKRRTAAARADRHSGPAAIEKVEMDEYLIPASAEVIRQLKQAALQ